MICWFLEEQCQDFLRGHNARSSTAAGQTTQQVLREVMVVESVVPVRRWTWANHHRSHASYAAYDSGFAETLVISYDGWGNDGSFVVYYANAAAAADGGDVLQQSKVVGELRSAYGFEQWLHTYCGGSRGCLESTLDTTAGIVQVGSGGASLGVLLHALALKILNVSFDEVPALAARGQLRAQWAEPFRLLSTNLSIPVRMPPQGSPDLRKAVTKAAYSHSVGCGREDRNFVTYEFRIVCVDWSSEQLAKILGVASLPLTGADADDAAATFEFLIESTLAATLDQARDVISDFEGVVLAGGAALYTPANSAMAGLLHPIAVHVPAAPHDATLCIGAAWLVSPPRRTVSRDGLGVAGGAALTGLRLHGHNELYDLRSHDRRLSPLGWASAKGGCDVSRVVALLQQGRLVAAAHGRAGTGFRPTLHRAVLSLVRPGAVHRMRTRYRWSSRVTTSLFVMNTPEILDAWFAMPEGVQSSPFMAFAFEPAPLLQQILCGTEQPCDDSRRFIVSTVDVESSDRTYSLIATVLLCLLGAGEPPALIAGPLTRPSQAVLNDVASIIAMVEDEAGDGIKHAVLETWLFDGLSRT
jgi:predicted NodU family carbamoyl transferase